MKRILCMTLMLCLLLPCFFSCEQEKEWNIPETAETLYPVVEGRRVPFKYLFTAEPKNVGECFILRSVEDVKQGFKQEFLDTLGMQEELEALLLGIDYDKYQVLGLSASLFGITPNLVELIDQEGTICVVYERKDQVWEEEKLPDTDIDGSFYLGNCTVVILVRKSDFDLSHIDRTFSANADQYLCYSYDPEYIRKLRLYS